MSYRVLQTRRFLRQYKKLHANTILDVDAAIAYLAENPLMGEQKRGDLAEMRVVKFRSLGQLYLLAYSLEEEIRLIYLEALGSHENFYRNLK